MRDNPQAGFNLANEQKVIARIKKAFPGVQISETDKDKPARVDILIHRNNSLKALGEIKALKYSYADLAKFGGTVLVTFSKLQDGALLSRLLKADFFIFIYLIPEDKIHYWKISNSEGEFVAQFDVMTTTTQATQYGGTAERENAFLPLQTSIYF